MRQLDGNNTDEEEDDDECCDECEKAKLPFSYIEQNVVKKIHHFYISEDIREPRNYVTLIHRLTTASEHEIVHLHLNTNGGQLDTGVQIINAMAASKAHVICSIEGMVYSLGTLIFLSANEMIVHKNCMIMLHTYSGAVSGKGSEQVAELMATVNWFKILAHEIYSPFLSAIELEDLISGKDFWFDSNQIISRLSNKTKS